MYIHQLGIHHLPLVASSGVKQLVNFSNTLELTACEYTERQLHVCSVARRNPTTCATLDKEIRWFSAGFFRVWNLSAPVGLSNKNGDGEETRVYNGTQLRDMLCFLIMTRRSQGVLSLTRHDKSPGASIIHLSVFSPLLSRGITFDRRLQMPPLFNHRAQALIHSYSMTRKCDTSQLHHRL